MSYKCIYASLCVLIIHLPMFIKRQLSVVRTRAICGKEYSIWVSMCFHDFGDDNTNDPNAIPRFLNFLHQFTLNEPSSTSQAFKGTWGMSWLIRTSSSHPESYHLWKSKNSRTRSNLAIGATLQMCHEQRQPHPTLLPAQPVAHCAPRQQIQPAIIGFQPPLDSLRGSCHA